MASTKSMIRSVKVRLRKKRGKGWQYQEIEIPTDAEMERIATDLHAKHVPALTSCLGWKVFYNPAKPFNYSLIPVNPFTGEQGHGSQHQTRTLSYCVFGYDSDWQVCYSWNRGENNPPMRIQERGDVVPLATSGTTAREVFFEGAVKRAELSVYERSPEARRMCIQHYGTKCSVCDFDFGKVYGQLAEGFIHVHHLTPLARIGAKYTVDPVRDLRPVCPNCHAVLHMKTPPLDIDVVKKIIINPHRLI